MISTVIVGLVVLACLGIAAKHIYKLFRGETSCCGTEAPKVPEKKLDGPIVGEKVVKIAGMTCGNCKNRVEMLLDDIDGAAAKVNLHRNQATVKMTRDVSDDEIRTALAGSGYEVVSIAKG
ncbi:MAG: heavy-metal-associated domain-containing protein [Selenomonadaceae bacterium]|nr:heavy-metal-associated domain-containing protein [Selenomonadaceae bacterium]